MDCDFPALEGDLRIGESLANNFKRGALQQNAYTLVDSCTAPDNALLNELWPDRKLVADIIIGRKSMLHGSVGRIIAFLKQGQRQAQAA